MSRKGGHWNNLVTLYWKKGALVPLSKKKRYFTAESFSPPEFSVLLWSPFLQHLHSLHSDFLIVLCDRIVSALVEENDTRNGLVEQTDHSYGMCLARWAMWSIEMWERDNTRSDFDLKKEVTMSLMQVLGRAIIESPRSMKAATALLERVCADNRHLEVALSALLQFSKDIGASKWSPDDLSIMDQRLTSLTSMNITPDTEETPFPSLQTLKSEGTIPGWRLLDESSGWTPCPIGVHYVTT